jgi:hypothetical protein
MRSENADKQVYVVSARSKPERRCDFVLKIQISKMSGSKTVRLSVCLSIFSTPVFSNSTPAAQYYQDYCNKNNGKLYDTWRSTST